MSSSCDSDISSYSSSETDTQSNHEDYAHAGVMPLPPENFYASEPELYAAIQEWAMQHNYAFRVGRSKKISKNRMKYMYFCDRCGQPPAVDRELNDKRRPNPRVRNTRSKKTGCEFSVCGVQIDDYHWDVRYRPDAKYNRHNHPPSHSPLEHSVHRRLDQEQIKKALELYNIGMFYQFRGLFKFFSGLYLFSDPESNFSKHEAYPKVFTIIEYN